ncbi:MAG TPA: aldehyde ferredoxin oxidoreductase family protein [Anaerolineae bacterium]|nr:aldehyde ferredoxin oxidoreductase family protein [Anaerolineae bacterium]
MALGGYANRIARIDLGTSTIEYEPIKEEDARMYVGGRGLGVKFLFDNGPAVEPLSPDNILCVMVGPLTGTRAHMNGRLCVVTKSPLTGTCTDSHMGGWTGAKLKWAGFDGLVFKGKAATPTYAYVEDGTVTLHDASDLWGKGVHETIKLMREKHGEDVAVMSIGPAGEKLVRFASWLNADNRASGRGGTGTVAGSKNLKCIVIKGDEANMPQPSDAEVFQEANRAALRKIREVPTTNPREGDLHVHGTNVLMNMVNEIGALPTRNAQRSDFAQADAIGGETVADTILVGHPACYACPVACKKEVRITQGKYAGLHMESLEYEPAWAFGANCDNGDINAVAAMIDRCNDFGLDAIEAGNALSMTMEATERGLVDGLPWGDTDAMMELIQKIAFREGIGDELAEGPSRAAAKWGAPEISMSVKGQSIAAYDPRGLKGMGIGFATSNRGACHLRGYTPAAEVVNWVLGAEQVADPLEWKGKGELVAIFQNVYGFTDSVDVCKFGTFAIPLDVYAALYSGMTGVDLDVAGLLKTGERIYNLERYYNNLNGFREGSDSLPRRFLEEPGTGAASESVCELDQMLEEYYKFRGWDKGVVPEPKLRELGIIE